MKKYILTSLVCILALGCESSTFEEISEEIPVIEQVQYTQHIKPIIEDNCIECHNPTGVSSFLPLTNYTEVKTAVEETNLLERIQLQNGEDGQMPQTGRMPQNLINLILQWNEQGLLE